MSVYIKYKKEENPWHIGPRQLFKNNFRGKNQHWGGIKRS